MQNQYKNPIQIQNPQKEAKQPPETNKISWTAFENFYFQKSPLWFTISVSIAIILLAIALFSKEPLTIIVFILTIVTFFATAFKMPDEIEITLDKRGVKAGNKFYPYHDLKSFWIFYNPPINYIRFKHKKNFSFDLKIIFEEEDPLILRNFLKENLPEKEEKEDFIDIMERILRI
ncbi:MAG: hypothetical protein V1698_01555 [bacterium]